MLFHIVRSGKFEEIKKKNFVRKNPDKKVPRVKGRLDALFSKADVQIGRL